MTRPITRPIKVAVLMSRVEEDCRLNIEELIRKGKQEAQNWNTDWAAPCWDVTEVFRHTVRSHRSERKHLNLWFSQRSPNGQDPGLPLPTEFGDIAKSFVVLRHQAGGQCVGSQMNAITASQFIFHQLAKRGAEFVELTVGDLHQACNACREALKETTAYTIQGAIEEIAAFVDKNRLCIRRLDFRYPHKIRPQKSSELTHSRLDDPDHAVPSSRKPIVEKVMKAIGSLYISISKSNVADRLRINAVTLAAFTGRRIGEILTMPASGVQFDEKGQAFLRIYAQKRSQGCQIIVPDKLYLIPQTTELIRQVIDECLELTTEARDSARYIRETKGPDTRILPSKEWFDSIELRDALGLSKGSRTAIEWIRSHGIALVNVPGKRSIVKRRDVIEAIRDELFLDPALHVSSPEGDLLLDDLLFIGFKNQFHSVKADLRYAVWPVNTQHISDFLGARGYGAFQTYFSGTEQAGYRVTSHQFRHTLNTLLQRGGMSDALQTEWFQRKRAADTQHYQHMTMAEKANAVLEVLHRDEEPKIVELRYGSREKAECDAQFRPVLDLGPGWCLHDWREAPCPRHLESATSQQDLYWVDENTDARLRELERLRKTCLKMIAVSDENAAAGQANAAEWARHFRNRLIAIESALACADKPISRYSASSPK